MGNVVSSCIRMDHCKLAGWLNLRSFAWVSQVQKAGSFLGAPTNWICELACFMTTAIDYPTEHLSAEQQKSGKTMKTIYTCDMMDGAVCPC